MFSDSSPILSSHVLFLVLSPLPVAGLERPWSVFPDAGGVRRCHISVFSEFRQVSAFIFLCFVLVELHCLYPVLLVPMHISMPSYVALCCSCHIPMLCAGRDVVNLSSYVSIRACPRRHVFSQFSLSHFSLVASPGRCFHLSCFIIVGFFHVVIGIICCLRRILCSLSPFPFPPGGILCMILLFFA